MNMPNAEPLVSCVIACYNRPVFVRDAIQSALDQTYPALEIIVVDDGSTDDTPQVLASYGDRIKVVRQQNAGTAAARNTGVAEASGKYLAWLDSDDAWLPQKIADQVAVAEEHPETEQVFTLCQAMDENGTPPPPSDPIPTPKAIIRDDILRMMVVESEVMTPSCLVRREALDAVGGFDPQYSAEDWELNFRLAQRGPFAFIPAPLTRVRIHGQRKTTDRWPHALGLLKLRHKIEAAREELLKRDPSPEMLRAYERHRVKYADAYYRVGRLALERGDAQYARDSLREAIRLNPRIPKYHTRRLRAEMLSLAGGRKG
ncbi:MAG TPA: glycosyltransferase [Capsulimonadaceae bacterium]|nr:glycosyltransferase [Capsulimonadaceae bacterium]